jgi:hypothetical protein
MASTDGSSGCRRDGLSGCRRDGLSGCRRDGLSGCRREEGPSGPRRDDPVFWKECYTLVVIGLGGLLLALAVLPPRLARHRQLLEFEADLLDSVQGLQQTQAEYEAAIMAVENDVFFRDEVYRTRLGLKRGSEEFLKDVAPSLR